MRQLLTAGLALTVMVGCGPSQTDDDQANKAQEFSSEGYQEGMIDAGKAEELEAAKQREADYLNAAGGQTDDQEQQPGP